MKNIDDSISSKIIELRNQFLSKEFSPMNLPELKRPDDDAIREYVESHKDCLSLTDFADCIIKNATK